MQIIEEMRNESQHRVFPALVLITATHLLYIEGLINDIGIRAYTLMKDAPRSAAVVDLVWTSSIRL